MTIPMTSVQTGRFLQKSIRGFSTRTPILGCTAISSASSLTCNVAGSTSSSSPCRHYSSSSPKQGDNDTFGDGGGAGYGNVHDRMMPTSDEAQSGFMYHHCKAPKTVSIIGAPMTYGQPFVGTDSGPTLLREAGLLSHLSQLGWRVEDLPDLDFETICHPARGLSASGAASSSAINAKNSLLVGLGAKALAEVVEEKIREGRFPLILGGDHSIGIGSLAGILKAHPNIGVIWVDAHADLNTPDISESGNMHGMPIGMLMEGMTRDHHAIPGLEWLDNTGKYTNAPRLSPDCLVYVGLRDVDAAERSAIRELGIKAYTMHDIDHYGIGRVMDMALGYLLSIDPDRPLHVSYDIDAVDPTQAPATGTAVRGGLTFREAHYVAEAVAKSGALASAEVVEVNPTLSDGKGARETVDLGLQIITSLMGKSII
eukprot:CAMPEP_0185736818 /NCGR_PEP_ID=MMETSP1171-20130828/28855_1 /TAXON_ID=374046 /ORGANISM="Helicotheca tamensis, Strain CCMP826" /LENGTH=426 /DNA_ID=CAMNT_0028407555 /DNA_START=92 /DNA_END=1372 /DNA_ORIENTATION=-